jgi:hypothetical protein
MRHIPERDAGMCRRWQWLLIAGSAGNASSAGKRSKPLANARVKDATGATRGRGNADGMARLNSAVACTLALVHENKG